MKKLSIIVIVNVVVFIGLRYLNIIHIFMKGGFGNNYVSSIWDFLPALLIQIVALLVLFFFHKNEAKKQSKYYYLISILIISLLYLLSHFRLIPNSVVPY